MLWKSSPARGAVITTVSRWNTAKNYHVAVMAGAPYVPAPCGRGANMLLLIPNPKKQVWLVLFYKWLAQEYATGNWQSRIRTQVQILLPHHTTHMSSGSQGSLLYSPSET